MKPKCDACAHTDRDQLDVQLARGVAISVVGEAFSLPVTTLVWHLERHLRGIPKRTGANPHDLVEDLRYIQSRAETVLETVLREEKHTVAMTAIRELRETVLAIAKLTHAEKSLDPTWYLPLFAEVKGRILKAVEDHPDVRDRIIAALSIEDKGKNNGA
jgi:hypothetical protein